MIRREVQHYDDIAEMSVETKSRRWQFYLLGAILLLIGIFFLPLLPFGLIIGLIGAGLGAIGELIGKRILG